MFSVPFMYYCCSSMSIERSIFEDGKFYVAWDRRESGRSNPGQILGQKTQNWTILGQSIRSKNIEDPKNDSLWTVSIDRIWTVHSMKVDDQAVN